MMNKILFLGATGMLGRPVIRRLRQEEGFSVRALVRNPEKARKILPQGVEIVQGDLSDIASIKASADGIEAVYLNLSTENFKSAFKPELDGTKNLVEALKDRKQILIAKLSGLSAGDENLNWLDNQHKRLAEKYITDSGHPYLLFRASWFMESLPLFVRNNRFAVFGKQPHNWRWIAGDDYGRMVATAFKKGLSDRIFYVQGVENCTWEQAGKRFLEAFDPQVQIIHIPLPVLKVLTLFLPQMVGVYPLLKYMNHQSEPFYGTETWDTLWKPALTIEDYVKYIRDTGDVPKKGK